MSDETPPQATPQIQLNLRNRFIFGQFLGFGLVNAVYGAIGGFVCTPNGPFSLASSIEAPFVFLFSAPLLSISAYIVVGLIAMPFSAGTWSRQNCFVLVAIPLGTYLILAVIGALMVGSFSSPSCL